MALKREQAQTRYATQIAVNRGTGFSSLANAYNKRSQSFDQLTDSFAKTVLDEIQTQGKKIGQEAAENVQFVDELITREQPDGTKISFTTRKPVTEYIPRTRSEQDTYEKELSQRYVLELRKLGRQQVREKAQFARENYLSHDEFDASVQPILEALLADVPSNVRNLASTYIEEDRHQAWISVMDNKRRFEEAVAANADKLEINELISQVAIGFRTPDEAKQELQNLFSENLYYKLNSTEILDNIDSYGYFKSKTDGLFAKDPADMTLEELTNAASDSQKINLVLRGTGGTTVTLSNGQTITGSEAIQNINQAVRQKLITEHTAKNASYSGFLSDQETFNNILGIYSQSKGDTSLSSSAKYASEDPKDLIKTNTNVPEEYMEEFVELYPFDPINADNPNNRLYNEDGTINKNAVLLSTQYAIFTLDENGQMSTPLMNELIATADSRSENLIEKFMLSGLGDAMFEKYEIIKAPNGRTTAVFNDISGHIDLPKRVLNALRFINNQAKVGNSPEEISQKLSKRTTDMLENPQDYTLSELIRQQGGPTQGMEFMDQVYLATEKSLKEIANAYYDETSEGDAVVGTRFGKSSYATAVTSIAVQRLLEDHIYDLMVSNTPLDSNAAIKDEVKKYLVGLIRNNSNFGYSQYHWSQDGFALQVGDVDFNKVSSVGTLAILPFEKQMSVNGDYTWAIDMVNGYIRQSDLYEEGYLKDQNAKFGGRIRVDALDYTSPARYALIHIDTDGFIQPLTVGGEDIIIDARSEKEKYIQKFRPGQEAPEYNYDITRQFQ